MNPGAAELTFVNRKRRLRPANVGSKSGKLKGSLVVFRRS